MDKNNLARFLRGNNLNLQIKLKKMPRFIFPRFLTQAGEFLTRRNRKQRMQIIIVTTVLRLIVTIELKQNK